LAVNQVDGHDELSSTSGLDFRDLDQRQIGNWEERKMKYAALVACLFAMLISTTALAQSNPVPFINQPLVPASAVPGSQGFNLTINGTDFVSGAVVNWNGVPHTTEVFSNSKVQATINASDVKNATTASVTVLNPPPGGGTSNVVYFPIRNSSSSVELGRIDSKIGYNGTVARW
jgi:hypothetical protein